MRTRFGICQGVIMSRIAFTMMGCMQLYLLVAGSQPVYHIFGHIHEEGLKRKAMLGGTTYLNVSYFDELRKRIGL